MLLCQNRFTSKMMCVFVPKLMYPKKDLRFCIKIKSPQKRIVCLCQNRVTSKKTDLALHPERTCVGATPWTEEFISKIDESAGFNVFRVQHQLKSGSDYAKIDHIWLYMTIYAHIWPYMTIYDHIRSHITIYDHI